LAGDKSAFTTGIAYFIDGRPWSVDGERDDDGLQHIVRVMELFRIRADLVSTGERPESVCELPCPDMAAWQLPGAMTK